MSPLAGRVAVVTGAATGIGSSIAALLHAEGAAVVSLDTQPSSAELAVNLHSERSIDVSVRGQMEGAMAEILTEFGHIDILVNNAGRDILSPDTWNMGEDAWSKVLDVHLNAPWWAARAVVPAMIDQGFGRIVFISSNAVRLGGFGIGHSPAYTAAKAGVIGLTVALSSQLEAHGIRVNAVCPGPTGSTGTPLSEVEREEYLSRHPLGFGGPEPIAEAVRYLVLSSGDWVSGTVLNVSGGEHRGI